MSLLESGEWRYIKAIIVITINQNVLNVWGRDYLCFAVFIIPVVCVTVSNFCVWFDWKEMNSERRWEVADPRDGVFRTKRFYTQCHVM